MGVEPLGKFESILEAELPFSDVAGRFAGPLELEKKRSLEQR